MNTQAKERQTTLMNAACKGHNTCFEMLLQAGANVNAQTKEAQIALMNAAHIPAVKNLLKRSLNVNVSNIKGFTALTNATCQGHRTLVEMLLQAEADVKASRCSEPIWNAHIPAIAIICPGNHFTNLRMDGRLSHIKICN